MIAVLMRNKDAVEACRTDAKGLKSEGNLSRTETGVDKDPASVGGDQRAVPRAATAKHRQTKHAVE